MSYYTVDISGNKFGRLTALHPTENRGKKGSVIWACQCSCGKMVEVSYNELLYTNRRSCGCQKKEHDVVLRTYLIHVDGTSIDMIKSRKVPSNNTSGVRGVGFDKRNGKWFAKINFQKTQIHLGSYPSFEEAVAARKRAEVEIFDACISHYEKWEEKAKEDPNWAYQNPFTVKVNKEKGKWFQVTFLP